jgi:hypothetical protein
MIVTRDLISIFGSFFLDWLGKDALPPNGMVSPNAGMTTERTRISFFGGLARHRGEREEFRRPTGVLRRLANFRIDGLIRRKGNCIAKKIVDELD